MRADRIVNIYYKFLFKVIFLIFLYQLNLFKIQVSNDIENIPYGIIFAWASLICNSS
jgi:hypothetical protein